MAGLLRMHALGRLAPEADPRQLALATLAALQGGLLLAKVQRDPEPLAAALDAMIALIEDGSSLPGICISQEQQIDIQPDLPADGVATARQLHLPVESELAAVEARPELQACDLAEAGQPRCGEVTARADRARHAPDRELAVDLDHIVVARAGRLSSGT